MIRTMTNADRAHLPNVQVVRDYPGHEDGLVRHAATCPHHAKRDLSGVRSAECPVEVVKYGDEPAREYRPCSVFGPLYMETTHVGLVLALGERNGYDDSDFYATVWNPEKGITEQIEYASTRGWAYPNGASVDATPEVVAAYEAWVEAARVRRLAEAALIEAATPRLGKTVKVVKGRKVKVGTIAEVVWVGRDSYSGQPRLGLRLLDGTREFTSASNVAVVPA